MSSQTLSYAIRLHALKPTWETFFREVFGLAGAIAKEFPSHEDRMIFERTQDYLEAIKMFSDILETNHKPPKMETKEIVLRVPLSVHEWMQDRASKEGFKTLSKYAMHRLLQGCLEPDNGRNGSIVGLTSDIIPMPVMVT